MTHKLFAAHSLDITRCLPLKNVIVYLTCNMLPIRDGPLEKWWEEGWEEKKQQQKFMQGKMPRKKKKKVKKKIHVEGGPIVTFI